MFVDPHRAHDHYYYYHHHDYDYDDDCAPCDDDHYDCAFCVDYGAGDGARGAQDHSVHHNGCAYHRGDYDDDCAAGHDHHDDYDNFDCDDYYYDYRSARGGGWCS